MNAVLAPISPRYSPVKPKFDYANEKCKLTTLFKIEFVIFNF